MRLIGTPGYYFVVWPGVVIHELSHFIGALVTLTSVQGFSLIPEEGEAGELLLGKVVHEDTHNPFKKVIIAGAPFIGGSLALWIFFRAFAGNISAPSVTEAFTGNIMPYLQAWWQFIVSVGKTFHYQDWTHWLFLYCIFSISSQLAPSWHDLKYALIGLAEIAAVVILFLFILYAAHWQIPASVIQWCSDITVKALVFFGLAAALLFFIAGIMIIISLIDRSARYLIS